MTVHRTIALDDTENARLEELAQYHGVSVTELMLESAQRIIEEDKAVLAAVQKGIDEIEAGHFLTHEEVVARSAARLTHSLRGHLPYRRRFGGDTTCDARSPAAALRAIMLRQRRARAFCAHECCVCTGVSIQNLACAARWTACFFPRWGLAAPGRPSSRAHTSRGRRSGAFVKQPLPAADR